MPATKQKYTTGIKDVSRFAGEWVAFADKKIIEHAETLPSLMAKIRRRKMAKEPSVMLVPRKDEGPYILFV